MKRVTLLVAAALVVLGLYVVLGAESLGSGSIGILDKAGLEPSREFYLYAPNTDYYLMTAIRNGGSLPVSINGLHQSGDPADPGPSAVEYLLARGTDPATEIIARADAAPFSRVELSPGKEVWVWIRFHTGPCPASGSMPYPPGSGTVVAETLVDWSILGVPRVSEVPLSLALDVRNPDRYDLCNQ